jgi:hypothetical protein
MRTPLGRTLIGLAAVAAAVVLFVVLSGDDDSDEPATTPAAATTTTEPGTDGDAAERPDKREKPEKPPEPQVATIVVRDGEPVGGVQELTFSKGDDIRFVVESDVADEVHLHGYDVTMDVEAGGKAEFDLPATLDGVFEVELHHQVLPLAEITVEP